MSFLFTLFTPPQFFHQVNYECIALKSAKYIAFFSKISETFFKSQLSNNTKISETFHLVLLKNVNLIFSATTGIMVDRYIGTV